MTNDRRTGGRIGGSDFSINKPSETPAEEPKAEQVRLDGYQPKKSNPPEKRTPPRGGSNVTPPAA